MSIEAPVSPRTPATLSGFDLPHPAVVQRRIRERGHRLLFRLTTLGWFTADLIIAVTSVLVAFMVTPFTVAALSEANHVGLLECAIGFGILLGTFAHIAGLQNPRYFRRTMDLVGRCVTAVSLALTVLTLELMIFHYLRMGRYIFFTTATLSAVAMVASRLLAWHFTQNYAQSICFVGADDFCFRAAQFVDGHPLPYRIETVLYHDSDLPTTDLFQWMTEQYIDEVVYDDSADLEEPSSLLKCLDYGIAVSSYSDFVEANFLQVPVDHIDERWLFSARVDLAHPYYHGLKRVFDIVLSGLGLVVTAPIVMVAMLAIRLENCSPVIYSQVRVGRFNRHFRIYKLGTMVKDAELNGAQWASSGDARVTRVGKILRLTRIDEFPQFWNILKGDMSLVGPRPERPEFVRMLAQEIPFYVERHLVKPGLTGWAQINYPYGASVGDALHKLSYDFYYVKKASVWLDLQIVLRTVGAVMKGAR